MTLVALDAGRGSKLERRPAASELAGRAATSGEEPAVGRGGWKDARRLLFGAEKWLAGRGRVRLVSGG